MQSINYGMLNGAIRFAIENNPENEGDYRGEDGLLMCGKCHTKKETITPVQVIGGKEIGGNVIPYACECRREQQRQEEEERRREHERARIEAMKDYGLKDAQYRESTFAADDGGNPEASRICKAYADNWEKINQMERKGKGLLLHGDVGSGKTYLAASIANALIDKGVAVIMTNLPALGHAMTANFGDERESVLRRVKTVPLLIIDDFGMERNTPSALENAIEIINTRYKSGKPLIITTNLTMDVFKSTKETNYSRLYTRVQEMCPTGVKVNKAGRRQALAKESHDEMQKILGLK